MDHAMATRTPRRLRAALVLLGAAALAAVPLLPGTSGQALAGPPRATDELAERRERALAKARAWLDDHVFGLVESEGTPRKPFTVALYGLIELKAGGASREARRGSTVARARRYLEQWLGGVETRASKPDQLPPRHGLASSRHLVQYTWPAALALWFLADAESSTARAMAPRSSLRRLAELLADAQDANGGFGHGRIHAPAAGADDGLPFDVPLGYPSTLVSSTYVVLAALGHARGHLGPAIEGVGQKAVDHLVASQLPGGLQPYDTSQRSAHGDPTGIARAAGAAYALHAWGLPWTHRHQVRALEQVDERVDLLSEGHGSSMLGLWFGAMLARARGERAWAAFRKVHLPALLDGQHEDGRLPCPCRGATFGATDDDEPLPGLGASLPTVFRDGTDAYVTALGTLILLLDRGDGPSTRPARPRGDITPR
ncbi:MAG: hypothetical protein AB7T63_14760 [Planctomycetota bacterium]